MLVISAGHARVPGQPGACGSNSCMTSGKGTAPPGFPQDNPACPPSKTIDDDVGLQLQIRMPTNATGYSFAFKFYSEEYPYYVCDSYNDQFIALVSPAPMGSINGNISFDSKNNPVSVNLGFFDVCDPTPRQPLRVGLQERGLDVPLAAEPLLPERDDRSRGHRPPRLGPRLRRRAARRAGSRRRLP